MIVPLLQSTRLRLRQYQVEDLPHFAALNSDTEVRKHVGGPMSDARIVQYLDEFSEKSEPHELRSWAIEISETRSYIGHAWLLNQGKQYQPDVGILISRAYWGNLYGSEAISEICRFATGEFECPCAYASVDIDNLRSQSMLRRAGFKYLATEKDEEGNYFIFVTNGA